MTEDEVGHTPEGAMWTSGWRKEKLKDLPVPVVTPEQRREARFSEPQRDPLQMARTDVAGKVGREASGVGKTHAEQLDEVIDVLNQAAKDSQPEKPPIIHPKTTEIIKEVIKARASQVGSPSEPESGSNE